MRVLVTRAQEDAERTSAQLRLLGHEALIAPVIRIAATGTKAPAGDWDALIVTSLHAADALATLAGRHTLTFAVGRRTADAVRQLGFQHVRVAEGDAVSLSALIRRELDPGKTLLHVTATHHKEEPARSLHQAGYSVTLWEAYAAEAVESLPDAAKAALRQDRIDAALHYSRRSAELFLTLARKADLVQKLETFPHFCLSEDVAEPLRALALRVRAAASPDEPALLRLLDL
jgi:uroporphyrinogen-III synthase